MLRTAAISLFVAEFAAASLYGESYLNHTCAIIPPALSCSSQAQANVTDSCCAETFGGLVLSTQFWDTYTGLESTGQVLPKASWSIHGLWPDFCNGSYTQYCDLKRQYDPAPSPNTTNSLPNGTVVPPWTGPTIDKYIKKFGKYDLLAFMKKYWIAQNQPDTTLWAHEFSKHATCFSSFDVECYGRKAPQHVEVIDFFETAISYYLTLPTYDWLGKAGIYPSNTTTVSLAALQAALTDGYGALPYIGCAGPRYNATGAGKGSSDNGRTIVSEVWYYQHVLGRVQSGVVSKVGADINGGSVSSCAKAANALTYPMRATGSEA